MFPWNSERSTRIRIYAFQGYFYLSLTNQLFSTLFHKSFHFSQLLFLHVFLMFHWKSAWFRCQQTLTHLSSVFVLSFFQFSYKWYLFFHRFKSNLIHQSVKLDKIPKDGWIFTKTSIFTDRKDDKCAAHKNWYLKYFEQLFLSIFQYWMRYTIFMLNNIFRFIERRTLCDVIFGE